VIGHIAPARESRVCTMAWRGVAPRSLNRYDVNHLVEGLVSTTLLCC